MKKFPCNLSDSERLSLAKHRTERLVDHIICKLFLMHKSNASIIYSRKLSEQIPRSYAAHAFNQFQHGMYLFEIIRLCALWDKARKDRESIPTIIALFDKPELIDQLLAEARALYENEDLPDTIKKKFADEAAETARCKLSLAISKANEVQASRQLKSLQSFRNNYIAYNLDIANPSGKGMASVETFKYGDETFVLDATVVIADALHRGLNHAGIQWSQSRDMARRNAQDLWNHCTFDIPTHRDS